MTEFEDVLTRDKNLKQYNNLDKEDVVAFIDILTPKEYLIKIGVIQ